MPTDIRKLPCFDAEIPMDCMQKWEELYRNYREDMTNALKDPLKANDEADEVIKMYKQVNAFQLSVLSPGFAFICLFP